MSFCYDAASGSYFTNAVQEYCITFGGTQDSPSNQCYKVTLTGENWNYTELYCRIGTMDPMRIDKCYEKISRISLSFEKLIRGDQYLKSFKNNLKKLFHQNKKENIFIIILNHANLTTFSWKSINHTIYWFLNFNQKFWLVFTNEHFAEHFFVFVPYSAHLPDGLRISNACVDSNVNPPKIFFVDANVLSRNEHRCPNQSDQNMELSTSSSTTRELSNKFNTTVTQQDGSNAETFMINETNVSTTKATTGDGTSIAMQTTSATTQATFTMTESSTVTTETSSTTVTSNSSPDTTRVTLITVTINSTSPSVATMNMDTSSLQTVSTATASHGSSIIDSSTISRTSIGMITNTNATIRFSASIATITHRLLQTSDRSKLETFETTKMMLRIPSVITDTTVPSRSFTRKSKNSLASIFIPIIVLVLLVICIVVARLFCQEKRREITMKQFDMDSNESSDASESSFSGLERNESTSPIDTPSPSPKPSLTKLRPVNKMTTIRYADDL